MTATHGFELIRDEQIVENNTRARIWRHVKSGAELLSLENDDENKVFGIAFRTPPSDSTGVPHIMEHSVLGGSRKFQVKEPFVELLKGSLNTFLNAVTFPDKTIYPVASTNLQDFYNLVDVYLDAVFFPLITPQHLQQEGWHYELESPDAPLKYKGVVFNEMKGAYSSPDNLLYRYSQQSLFPDNAYGFDSGGNPAVIPDLTYEQFKSFHDTFYHPGNSMIYFYGDDEPQERLRLLDEYLSEFDCENIEATIELQSPFPEPKRVIFPYSVESEQGNGAPPKAMMQVNWMLPEFANPDLVMALTILSYALVSTPASPLRKALIDSGLGEDITGGGLSTYTRQMTFAVGLKGIDMVNIPKAESLIEETLSQLAQDGLEPAMVEAAVNTIEFALRENNTGPYPRGLNLLINSLNTWVHGRDPLVPLRYEAPLNNVKQKLADDGGFLQELIRTSLLDNTHRATVILEPDPALATRLDEAEKSRLASSKSAMTGEDLAAIMETMNELRQRQQTPDSLEALASLPVLTLEDLDKESKTIPIEIIESNGHVNLLHDLFTNGIVYLDIGFDLHTLPQELLPYVGLLGQVFLEMGTEKEDFVKFSQRIGRKTGGISSTAFTSALRHQDDGASWFFLRGKATMDQGQDLLDILLDILLSLNLDNQERFRQIVLEAKAGKEAGLIPGGHGVVNTRLRARFNTGDWVAEQIGGLEYLFFLRKLAKDVDEDWPEVLSHLQTVCKYLVNSQSMIFNVTLDADNWKLFESQLQAFQEQLPANPRKTHSWRTAALPDKEGLTIPAQVNYVAKGANLYELGYQLHGSISVITNFLRTSWLWEKIRVQGGAYGGFCLFRKQSGVFSYLSYRDPNLTATLDNYDKTAEFLRNVHVSEDELTKNIIGAIGTIDQYQLPDAKGFTSLQRYLVGETDEERQAYRDEVLSTSEADFRGLAAILEKINEHGSVVVLGSATAIQDAQDQGEIQQVSQVM